MASSKNAEDAIPRAKYPGAGKYSGAGRYAALAVLVCLSVSFAAVCGKDSTTNPAAPTPTPTPTPTPPQPDPARPTKIDITPATVAPLTRIGQIVQLSATVKDQYNNVMTGVQVVWKSSNPQIARVSAGGGLVTAVHAGTVTVSATAGSVTGTVQVHVVPDTPQPASIVIAPAVPDTLIEIGQTLQLSATARDADGNAVTDISGVWESSDARIVTVSRTGLVTAVGNGSASVSFTMDGLLRRAVTVHVRLNMADRETLTLLYHLTGGPNWSNDTNWLSEEPVREWYGVETYLSGSVVDLRLEANNLTGVIPPELARMTGLRDLRLRNNPGLSGTLPGELTDLALETLHLDETGVCAPPDAVIQAWLRGIPDRRLAHCGAADPDRSAAYLTQATQSFSRPVPLVAGDRALLRVFPVADSDTTEAAMPPVRATFYLDGAEVHVVEAPGSDADMPTRVDEGSLAASVNAEVPGHVIAPGLEMVIEIDPPGDGQEAPEVGVRLPATGRTPVDVKDVPALDLTLVPFLWEENPDRTVLTETEGVTADSWLFRATRDLLPVREFRLTVRDYVWTQVEPVFDNAGALGAVIRMIRATDGGTGHYMGLISDGGVADRGGFHSLARFQERIMAHELGHNMNLAHAPCNIDTDEYYPHADGSVGSWGYNFIEERLISPGTPDLMGYCGHPWIGAYSFTRALNYRHYREGVLPAPVAAVSARSLLVWGGVDEHGGLYLEPAFLVDAPPTPLQTVGPYWLVGEDAAGAGLFSLSFGMPEIHGDGYECGGLFAFVLPMGTDWLRRLSRVTLSGPEGFAELDGESGRTAALLLDRVTGSVRGYLADWPAHWSSPGAARRVPPEPGLEVLVSRGLPGPSLRTP